MVAFCGPIFFRLAVFSCALVCAGSGCQRASQKSAAEARPLRVAAASDVEPAFTEIGRLFTQKSATQRKVVFSFAASSVLAQQVEQGAPFDLYAAANTELVEKLVAGGKIVRGSSRPYARGQLAVYRKKDAAPPSLKALLADDYKRIALANPAHAPYGQAAVQALRSAGLFDALANRLIYGENVRQAHQYVETGNADVVIGALALALQEKQSYLVVPENLYSPLVQVLGVVTGGDEAGAKEFVALVLSPDGQGILKRHGFLPAFSS